MPRLRHIDWLRGFAVAVMIEAHSIDAWIRLDERARPLYSNLVFLAGWAAPLFLWLAGVSVALSGAARITKGAGVGSARRGLVMRGLQIFGLGFAFRFYTFLLGPGKTWEGMLKPDILNILGLGMMGAAWCWGRGASRVSRALWQLVPAAACVALASIATGWSWPAHLPHRFEAYLRTNGYGTFEIFPWAGFVFVGAITGDAIADAVARGRVGAVHARIAAAGVLLAVGAYAGSFLPSPLPRSRFWTTSIAWFTMRWGVMLVLLALTWLALGRRLAAVRGVSFRRPVLLFGQTSLFVYWIHLELVYGFFSFPLHHALTPGAWLVAYTLFCALMALAAIAWTRRPKRGEWLPWHLRADDDLRPVRGAARASALSSRTPEPA